jgi:hypothetical protein
MRPNQGGQMIKIERYKNTRHWAVWCNDTLLAVVCYKKGATAIKQILNKNLDRPKPVKPIKSKKAP